MQESDFLSQKLKEKYNTSFTVTKDVYSTDLGCYVFEASCNVKGRMVHFSGKHNHQELIEENLIPLYFGLQLNDSIQSQITKCTGDFFASKFFFNTNYLAEEKIDLLTISLQTYHKTHPDLIELHGWIYLFKPLRHNLEHEHCIYGLVDYVRKAIPYPVSLNIDFWNEKVLLKGDPKTLRFGFGTYDANCADNPTQSIGYIEESLKLMIFPHSQAVYDLKKLVIPYKEKRFKDYVKI